MVLMIVILLGSLDIQLDAPLTIIQVLFVEGAVT